MVIKLNARVTADELNVNSVLTVANDCALFAGVETPNTLHNHFPKSEPDSLE